MCTSFVELRFATQARSKRRHNAQAKRYSLSRWLTKSNPLSQPQLTEEEFPPHGDSEAHLQLAGTGAELAKPRPCILLVPLKCIDSQPCKEPYMVGWTFGLGDVIYFRENRMYRYSCQRPLIVHFLSFCYKKRGIVEIDRREKIERRDHSQVRLGTLELLSKQNMNFSVCNHS